MNDAVLYLEVDEDITSAIDKLSKTTGQSIQIVVPKRSTMLQSIINQKLLKKAAADSGKELVIVTTDRIAKNLAASVGLAVAASVGAEAVMTAAEAPKPISSEDIIEEDDDEEASDAKKAAALAAATAVVAPTIARKKLDDKPSTKSVAPPAPAPEPNDDFSDELPADDGSKASDSAHAEDASFAAKVSKDGPKPPKVPNFGVLQRRMLWLGAAAVLIVGYIVAMAFLAKATVTMFAIGNKIDIDSTFYVDTNATKSDIPNVTLMGQNVILAKSLTGPVTPTGTKDVGTKATGTIVVSNCYDTTSHLFVAGTRFQSPDGKMFRSNSDAVVPGGQGTFLGCTTPGKVNIAVTADQNGDSYNEAPTKFTIPGLPPSQTTGNNSITASSTAAFAGGTSKTVTVVTQPDVDKAQADILSKEKDAAQKELDAKVPSGFMAFTSSFAVAVTSSTPNPAVDIEATTGSLAVAVSYSELAVPKADYRALILDQEQKQVGSTNEIYDNGLSSGQVTMTSKNGAGLQGFRFTTVAYGGPRFNKTKIANDIKGKKYGDAVDIVSKYTGVDHVDVALWPSWASNLPGNAAKITINIQIANSSK